MMHTLSFHALHRDLVRTTIRTGFMLAFLFAAGTSGMQASSKWQTFADYFNAPTLTGWTIVAAANNSTAVESGGLLSLSGNRLRESNGGVILIQSAFRFAAPTGACAKITLTADIASIINSKDPNGDSEMCVGLGDWAGNWVGVGFDTQQGFGLVYWPNGNAVQVPLLPAPYTGGPLTVTLELDATGARLTSGAYDSGVVAYPNGFSLAALGDNAAIGLMAGTESGCGGSGCLIDSTATVNFDSVLLTVEGEPCDTVPPIINGMPTDCTLWPPNHKMVSVATVSAADVGSGVASFNLTVTSNEPSDPQNPDWVITGSGLQPRTVQLRAERLGTGTGRLYTIIAEAIDQAGNSITKTATCKVPHDQGNK